MYHDILSLPSDVRDECIEFPWMFEYIVESYIKQSSPNGLAYAIPHFYQNNNPHAHIAFSANELESTKSVRISKAELALIKKKMLILEKSMFESLEKKGDRSDSVER